MLLPVDEPFGVGLENRLPAHRDWSKPDCELHPARGAGPFVAVDLDGQWRQLPEIERIAVEGFDRLDRSTNRC